MTVSVPISPPTTSMPVSEDAFEFVEPMSELDAVALAEAVRMLEHTSLAARLTQIVGRQLEFAGGLVPPRFSRAAARAATLGLEAALRMALRSLDPAERPPSPRLHKALAAISGGAGGAIGLASLPIELPLSATLMLRSIADVARSEGEDLTQPEAALACMQVFALGGRTAGDQGFDGGYFAVRGLFAKTISEAARYIIERGVSDEAAPILVRFVAQISTRFGVMVTQKAVAQSVPVIGAIGGAAINVAFIDHFQNLARGHFIVRRLERTYSASTIRSEYQRLKEMQAARS